MKKLAEKVTGVRPTGRTIAQIINAIADNYSGGGGGGTPIINITPPSAPTPGQTQIDVTIDKSFEEIKEMLSNGIMPVAKMQGYYFFLNNASDYTVTFAPVVKRSGETNMISHFCVDASHAWVQLATNN